MTDYFQKELRYAEAAVKIVSHYLVGFFYSRLMTVVIVQKTVSADNPLVHMMSTTPSWKCNSKQMDLVLAFYDLLSHRMPLNRSLGNRRVTDVTCPFCCPKHVIKNRYF